MRCKNIFSLFFPLFLSGPAGSLDNDNQHRTKNIQQWKTKNVGYLMPALEHDIVEERGAALGALHPVAVLNLV